MAKLAGWTNVNKIFSKSVRDRYILPTWFLTMSQIFPDKVQRVQYSCDEFGLPKYRTMIRDDFIKELTNRMYGHVGHGADWFGMKYGITEHEVRNAAWRLCREYPDVVYQSGAGEIMILQPQKFLQLGNLTPQEPFNDSKWLTAAQLEKKYPGKFSYWLGTTVEQCLRKFVEHYPYAVGGNLAVVRQTPFLNKYNPLRINREFLPQFEEMFKLVFPPEEKVILPSLLKRMVHVPYGFAFDELLYDYSVLYPYAVTTNNVNGKIYLRKKNLDEFRHYIAERERIAAIPSFLTASDILNRYRFAENPTTASLSRKIREYSKHNDMAVDRIIPSSYGRSDSIHKRYALAETHLQDFFKFANLHVILSPDMEKPVQPQIDPNAPGYEKDSTLEPISDKQMDAIAWRLAARRMPSSVARANRMLMAEIEQMLAKRGKGSK